MTALTHKENELHNRLIVAEFNLGQVEEELRRMDEENLQWQEKCQTYIELHDAVVKDSDRLYALNAELVEVLRRCAASLNPNHEHTAFVFAALAKVEGK